MPTWRFTLHYEASNVPQWTWSQLADDGAVMQESSAPFEAMQDCLIDATKHGYVSAPDGRDSDRRRERGRPASDQE